MNLVLKLIGFGVQHSRILPEEKNHQISIFNNEGIKINDTYISVGFVSHRGNVFESICINYFMAFSDELYI